MHASRRHWKWVAVVASAGLIAAACGGGSKKTANPTSTSLEQTTTTVVGNTSTSVAEGTPSTVSATTTTAPKATTKTTAKKSGSVASKVTALPKVAQGVAQVTAPPATASSEAVEPGGTVNALVAVEITSLDPARSGGGVGGGDYLRLFALYDALRQKGIEQSFQKIFEEVRTQYTLGYYTHQPFIDGKYRTIDVRVLRPNLTVLAKKGYYPTASDSGPTNVISPNK